MSEPGETGGTYHTSDHPGWPQSEILLLWDEILVQGMTPGSSSIQELHDVNVGPCCLDVGRTARDS